jgi:hypothetical protein
MRWVRRVVAVDLGGLRVSVAHPLLDRAQRRAGGGHLHTERVAQLVEGDLTHACAPEGVLEALAHLGWVEHVPGLGVAEDEVSITAVALPDLAKPLAHADPELRRQVYEAFQFAVELDRNKPEVRLKARLSSAFSTASDLDDFASMVANKAIAGAGFEPATFGL